MECTSFRGLVAANTCYRDHPVSVNTEDIPQLLPHDEIKDIVLKFPFRVASQEMTGLSVVSRLAQQGYLLRELT
jgi:hypothetical protein